MGCRAPANHLRGCGADSGKSFGAWERALAFPFVFFAQLGLVFFDLPFKFAEGLLATGPHRYTGACGMQRSSWQRQIQLAGILVSARGL